MGCWLSFAQWGLSPQKKHQAALGALTKSSPDCMERSGMQFWCSTMFGEDEI
jgi:hypothetical protein